MQQRAGFHMRKQNYSDSVKEIHNIQHFLFQAGFPHPFLNSKTFLHKYSQQ